VQGDINRERFLFRRKKKSVGFVMLLFVSLRLGKNLPRNALKRRVARRFVPMRLQNSFYQRRAVADRG
jgi:hypothetical protein